MLHAGTAFLRAMKHRNELLPTALIGSWRCWAMCRLKKKINAFTLKKKLKEKEKLKSKRNSQKKKSKRKIDKTTFTGKGKTKKGRQRK